MGKGRNLEAGRTMLAACAGRWRAASLAWSPWGVGKDLAAGEKKGQKGTVCGASFLWSCVNSVIWVRKLLSSARRVPKMERFLLLPLLAPTKPGHIDVKPREDRSARVLTESHADDFKEGGGVWVFQVLNSRVTPARSGLTSQSSRRGGYSATDSPRGGAVKLAEIHLCKE